MKKAKIAIRAKSTDFAESVADILHCIILSNAKYSGLVFIKRDNFNIKPTSRLLEFLYLLVVIEIVKKVSSQLDLSAAKDGEGFLFLSFGEV